MVKVEVKYKGRRWSISGTQEDKVVRKLKEILSVVPTFSSVESKLMTLIGLIRKIDIRKIQYASVTSNSLKIYVKELSYSDCYHIYTTLGKVKPKRYKGKCLILIEIS